MVLVLFGMFTPSVTAIEKKYENNPTVSLGDSLFFYYFKDTLGNYDGKYLSCNSLFFAQDANSFNMHLPKEWGLLSKDTVADYRLFSDSTMQLQLDKSRYKLIPDKLNNFLCFFAPISRYEPEVNSAKIVYNIYKAQNEDLMLYDFGVMPISDSFETRLLIREFSKEIRQVYLINVQNNKVVFTMLFSSYYYSDFDPSNVFYRNAERIGKNLFRLSLDSKAETYISFDENGQIIWNLDPDK